MDKHCKFCVYNCQWERWEFKLKQNVEDCPYYKSKS